MAAVHELKAWPEPFEAMRRGEKLAEFRRDDRGFEVGCFLVLREWDPATERYTGEELFLEVLHIVRGPDFGVPDGFVMMSTGSAQEHYELLTADVEVLRVEDLEALLPMVETIAARAGLIVRLVWQASLGHAAIALLEEAGEVLHEHACDVLGEPPLPDSGAIFDRIRAAVHTGRRAHERVKDTTEAFVGPLFRLSPLVATMLQSAPKAIGTTRQLVEATGGRIVESSQRPGLNRRKFSVKREDNRDAPGGDRAGAEYIVLDLTFCPAAREAARHYAAQLVVLDRAKYMDVALDILGQVYAIDGKAACVADYTPIAKHLPGAYVPMGEGSLSRAIRSGEFPGPREGSPIAGLLVQAADTLAVFINGYVEDAGDKADGDSVVGARDVEERLRVSAVALGKYDPDVSATICAPIPMLLFCPVCGVQHVDEAEPDTGWTNPPHRSHLCHACRHVWRPSDVPTTGVATLETRGSRDGDPSPAWGRAAPPYDGEATADQAPILSLPEATLKLLEEAAYSILTAADALDGPATSDDIDGECWGARHLADDILEHVAKARGTTYERPDRPPARSDPEGMAVRHERRFGLDDDDDDDVGLRPGASSGTCRMCGCTDLDCSQCIVKLGHPCSWTDANRTLCSACTGEA